jgi:hypothetical protein
MLVNRKVTGVSPVLDPYMAIPAISGLPHFSSTRNHYATFSWPEMESGSDDLTLKPLIFLANTNFCPKNWGNSRKVTHEKNKTIDFRKKFLHEPKPFDTSNLDFCASYPTPRIQYGLLLPPLNEYSLFHSLRQRPELFKCHYRCQDNYENGTQRSAPPLDLSSASR